MHQERSCEAWKGCGAFWIWTGHSGDLTGGKSLSEGKGLRKVMNSHCLRGRGNWPGISAGQDEAVPNGLGFFFPGGPQKGIQSYWVCVLLGREKEKKGGGANEATD